MNRSAEVLVTVKLPPPATEEFKQSFDAKCTVDEVKRSALAKLPCAGAAESWRLALPGGRILEFEFGALHTAAIELRREITRESPPVSSACARAGLSSSHFLSPHAPCAVWRGCVGDSVAHQRALAESSTATLVLRPNPTGSSSPYASGARAPRLPPRRGGAVAGQARASTRVYGARGAAAANGSAANGISRASSTQACHCHC